MACKVDTRLLACWLANPGHDAVTTLHSDKMKWCIHKDEIVLNTSKNNVDVAIKAYPMVITTVGDMKDRVQIFLASLYGKSSASDFHTLHELKTSTSTDPADVNAQKTAAGYDMTAGLADGSPNSPPSDQDWSSIKQQISSLPDFRECFMQDHWDDKIRVFAKCISGGRPFDQVDIMLMTQSL
jgi:hypothetical protein